MGKVGQIEAGADVSDRCLRAFIGYDMKRAFNALQADLMRTLAPFDLRMLTYSALSLIVQNPGLRPSHLAEALSIERANLVVVVDALEQRDLVTRTPSLSDRRAHALTATPAGQTIYEEATRAVETHDARISAGLGRDEVAALRGALRRIEETAKEATR